MRIIESSVELTAAQRYHLTKSPAVQKMKNCVGKTLNMEQWCMYIDSDKEGKEQRILSILTTDGEVYATNSPTFIDSFEEMQEIFTDAGEQVHAVNVISGTSKAGREYITCVYAG